MSRRMGKPTICTGENKGADQLRSNCEADQRLCFRYTDNYLFFLNPKFPDSNHLLGLYSPVCVRPGRNPNCWFSHAQAQIITIWKIIKNPHVSLPLKVNILFFFQNLTKEQADYCISRMKPYVDRSGRAIPDAYDYADFTGSMFVN